ncbi:MAG: ABC transporter permease [Firmicutes bacterium HGW-Firmicutes-14]|jgi:NitT/TauT family transport system permease protein|nr:MAG: ABC transporter permease [Firmicutes bacterium HGW-Firmicutes-14]
MKEIFRKRVLFILLLAVAWESAARAGFFPPLLFPSLGRIWDSLKDGVMSGELVGNAVFSLYLIITGLVIAVILTVLFSSLAMVSKNFDNFLDTAVAVMNPLPGIALLPLAILWFGTGQESIIFVIVHATLWPMILNTVAGFRTVPVIFREVGQNAGLTGPRLVFSIMVPAAFPYLLTGLKIGWSRAWRALIAAEMVFGTAGVSGGLGWFIYKQRYLMDISGVFAALIVIVLIGILVEDLFFGIIEKKTVRRWGMMV